MYLERLMRPEGRDLGGVDGNGGLAGSGAVECSKSLGGAVSVTRGDSDIEAGRGS
jgi:hypothetical protein